MFKTQKAWSSWPGNSGLWWNTLILNLGAFILWKWHCSNKLESLFKQLSLFKKNKLVCLKYQSSLKYYNLTRFLLTSYNGIISYRTIEVIAVGEPLRVLLGYPAVSACNALFQSSCSIPSKGQQLVVAFKGTASYETYIAGWRTLDMRVYIHLHISHKYPPIHLECYQYMSSFTPVYVQFAHFDHIPQCIMGYW